MIVVVDLEYLASGMVKYLSAILACILTPLLIIGCVIGNNAPVSPEATLPSPTKAWVVTGEASILEIATKVLYVKDPKTAETTKPLCFGVVRSLENTTHSYHNSPVSITYIPCTDIPPELLIK